MHRSKDYVLAIWSPAQRIVPLWIPRDPLRHTTFRAHNIYVRYAMFIGGVRNQRSVRRKIRSLRDGPPRRQALGITTVTRYGPDICCVQKRNLVLAERRVAQQ